MDTHGRFTGTGYARRLEACAEGDRDRGSDASKRAERILIVDPSGDLHGSFADTLKGAGHGIVPTTRTMMAREIHTEERIDLVIVHFDRLDRCDWKPLSVLHGSFPELPIVAVFSESRPSEILRAVARALGARRTLHMPLDRGRLLDAVRSAIDC